MTHGLPDLPPDFENPTLHSDFTQLEIKRSKAGKSYSISGERIAEGRKTDRVDLGDAKINVAAIKWKEGSEPEITGRFKKIYINLKCVKLQGDEAGNNIYVNVNSVAKRLHLTKQEVRSAAEHGTLVGLMTTQSGNLAESIEQYGHIAKAYGNEIELQLEIGLNRETLMRATKTALPILNHPETPKGDLASFKQEHRVFFAQKNASGNLELTVPVTFIAEGGFGVVKEAITLSSKAIQQTKEPMAYKAAKDSPKALRDIKSEYKILHWFQKLNGGTSPRGIQPAPIKFAENGYLTAKCETVEDIYRKGEPIEKRVRRGADIIAGVKFLHSNNVVHKDLKKENLLFKGDQSYVSDFGGARELNPKEGSYNVDSQGKKFFYWGAHTTEVTSPAHKAAAEQLWIAGNNGGSNDMIKENDVFATGVLLYEFFSNGRFPCTMKEVTVDEKKRKYPDNPVGNFKREHLEGVPDEIIDLIHEMLSAQPGNTPSIDTVLQRYEAAMAEHFPLV